MVGVVTIGALLLVCSTTHGRTYFKEYKFYRDLGENGKFIVNEGRQRLCYVCPKEPVTLPSHYYDVACYNKYTQSVKINGSFAFCNERYGTEPNCSAVLQPINKGFWDCDPKDFSLEMTVYKSCRAVCNEGYWLKHKDYAIRCGENLKLNNTLVSIQCVNLTRDCPALPLITNGSWNCTPTQLLNYSVYEFTLTCHAKCDPGWQLSHDLVVVCGEDLTWSKDYLLPTCNAPGITRTPDPFPVTPDPQKSTTTVEGQKFGEWWHILLIIAAPVGIIVAVLICCFWKRCSNSDKGNASSTSVQAGTELSSVDVSSKSQNRSATPETGYNTSSDRESSSSEQENAALISVTIDSNDQTSDLGTNLDITKPLLPKNADSTGLSDISDTSSTSGETVQDLQLQNTEQDEIPVSISSRSPGTVDENVTSSGPPEIPSDIEHQENIKGGQSYAISEGKKESKAAEQKDINSADSDVDNSPWGPMTFQFPSSLNFDSSKSTEERGPLSLYDPDEVSRGLPAGASTNPSVKQPSAASKNSKADLAALKPNGSCVGNSCDNEGLSTQAGVPQDNAGSFPVSSSACLIPSARVNLSATDPQHLSKVHNSGNRLDVNSVLDDDINPSLSSKSGGLSSHNSGCTERLPDNRYGQTNNNHRHELNLPLNRDVAEVEKLDVNLHIPSADDCGAENCSMSLANFIENPSATKCLETLDMMVTAEDLKSKNMDGLCHWMLHGKRENIPIFIKSCWKLKPGVPGNGPFSYIMNNDLVSLGFRLGHILYYFNWATHRRDDIINHIRKYHRACPYCEQFYR